MKILFLCLLFALPIFCDAKEISCKYNSSFIEETIPTDSSIQSFKWEEKIDTDSDEHIKKLIITYKSNDTAIIEHKYCDIYNFEYIYSTTKNPASLKKEDVIKRITKGFKQSKIKPAFRIKLDKIISQALNKHGYSTKESFSIGLPVDQVIYHDNVEYGLEYTPGKNGVAASTLIFYMSIGGNE